MVASLVISIITCMTMIGFIILKPTFTIKNLRLGTYWIVSLIGAIVLLIFSLVPFRDVVDGIFANTAINPIKILIIFITITVISVYLDEVGFFRFLASKAIKRAGNSQIRLFVTLYLLVSILTVFTSNDIIILTFTPFIFMFCKNAKINPIPYLISEFVAANTWSMFLIIGNPTNIYLATSLNIDFADYIKIMWLPTLLAGLTSFAVLFLLFYKKLKIKIENPDVEEVVIEDKFKLYLGVAFLVICIIGLALANYINLEMWMISLPCSLILFTIAIIYALIKKEKPVEVVSTLKRAPWELIPFVISMFIIVQALDYNGVTSKLYNMLNVNHDALVYGLSSALFANLLNNIPMSVLYSSVLALGVNNEAAVFASIIGSNIGAFLTPIGALAGIMWSSLLNKNNIKFSFVKFMKYGIRIGIPTLLAAILGVYILL